MDKKRIVITGVGVVAPNGIGKEAFWQALKEGKSGIKAITLFDTSPFLTKQAGECSDFSPEEHLGSKGLRNLDRATKLVLSATKLALEDSGYILTDQNRDDTGVVTATTLSVINNISEFTKEAQDAGPQFVNPAAFPGTTINSPSSQISIRFGIKAFNSTVSTGYTASLDALKYAADFISLNRAKAVLVAGVEALFFQSFLGFNKLEFLAGIKGEEISCPFDKRRNGIILAEGSGAILLEDAAAAQKRNARIYGELNAVKTFFDPFRTGKYNPKADGLKRAMQAVLKDAGIEPSSVDYILAAANSVVNQDAFETRVIKETFGNRALKIPVSAIKSMIGESISAAGILQIIAGIGAMEHQILWPTINYKEKDPKCDLDCVPHKSRKGTVNTVLINDFGPGGNNASALFSRWHNE